MSTLSSNSIPTFETLHAALAHSTLISAESDAAYAKVNAIRNRYIGRDEITYDHEIFLRIAVADGDADKNLREYLKVCDVFEAVPEFEAHKALEAALPLIVSAADVAAVVEHARAQGDRDLAGSLAEIGLMRDLVEVLTVKLYGGVAVEA